MIIVIIPLGVLSPWSLLLLTCLVGGIIVIVKYSKSNNHHFKMNQVTPQSTMINSSFILPPHNDRMAMSIICTLFCCLIGGIIAIVNASKSNSLYNSAILSSDDSMKQHLYYQSESSNETAKTWITISLIFGVIYVIAIIILAATGTLADLYF